MHVNFDIDRGGFWWTDALAVHLKIKPLYNKHGQAGLFYLIYFALPFSPYGFQGDLAERDKLVREHIAAEPSLNPKGGKVKARDSFPPNYYEQDDYILAVKALKDLGIGPWCFWEMQNLKEEEYKRANDLNKRTWIDDPDKRLKELSADDKAYNVLERVRKKIRELEDHINKRFAPDGVMLSLNDLLDET